MHPRRQYTRVWLARHGEVADSWGRRIYGSLDVPLSARGREEARKVATRLAGERLAVVVSSGLERAEFGAQLLREGRGLGRIDDAGLREIDRGCWAGLQVDEVERLYPGAWAGWHESPADSRPDGGESLDDLARRVLPRMQMWAADYRGEHIAIVAHGWVIRVVVCAALGLDLNSAPRLDIRTGDLAAIDWPADWSTAVAPQLSGFAVDRLPSPRTEG